MPPAASEPAINVHASVKPGTPAAAAAALADQTFAPASTSVQPMSTIAEAIALPSLAFEVLSFLAPDERAAVLSNPFFPPSALSNSVVSKPVTESVAAVVEQPMVLSTMDQAAGPAPPPPHQPDLHPTEALDVPTALPVSAVLLSPSSTAAGTATRASRRHFSFSGREGAHEAFGAAAGSQAGMSVSTQRLLAVCRQV